MFKFVKIVLLTALLFCGMIVSCQDDSATEYNSEALGPNSDVTLLLKSMSATDAESANTIDNNCIAIQYPVTIFGYNSSLQMENTYVIKTNAELYAVLQNLSANQYYSINYPLHLIVAGQVTISVSNNADLRDAVTTAVAKCAYKG